MDCSPNTTASEIVSTQVSYNETCSQQYVIVKSKVFTDPIESASISCYKDNFCLQCFLPSGTIYLNILEKEYINTTRLYPLIVLE